MGFMTSRARRKPRTISDEDVERVVVKTLEEQPRTSDALVDAFDGRRRPG